MNRVRLAILCALFVTATMVIAPVSALAAPVKVGSTASAPTASHDNVAAGFGAVTGGAGSATSSPNVASEMAEKALAATHAAGLSARVISTPRPSATAAQRAAAAAAGHVIPLYNGDPAPIGIGYFGLSEGAGGAVVPTILNTTSLFAQVNTQGSGIVPQDLFDSSPDSFGIQLNAVQTNVTLFGQPGYSFWTQNVVLFYAQAGFMILITNVWNFSGGPITQNAIYAHGPYGTDIAGTLGYYYSELVVPFPVVSPFNLSLWMNSSLVGGRDAVNFTVAVNGTNENFVAPYDYLVFNSTNATSLPLSAPSNYTANGYSYNPLGLTNDFEVIMGGPDGGSQADIGSADATMALSFWNATAGSYQTVPSAFSYGGETGETVSGVNVAWASGSGGPAGATAWGTLSAGPSILRGLWNAGAPAGATAVTLSVSPSNAFFVIEPVNTSAKLANFLSSEPAAVPGAEVGTLWLTPGIYKISVGLSDYVPMEKTVVVGSSPITFSMTLHRDMGAGIYTPLWAFSNSQLAAISTGGSGTASNPYLLFHNQMVPLGPVFGEYNDYVFPVWPGIFLDGTTATVAIEHGANLTAWTNTFQFPGKYLPSTNQLQFWFWGDSNVALVDTTITGWFGSTAYYPVDFDTFNVIFYASSGNLIAGNDFATEGQALLSFSGGSIFGAVNIGGGNNTIWGNWFTEATAPNSTIAVAPNWEGVDVGLAIELAESNDLIYNNYVDTPTTAWLLPLNLYSGDPFAYTDTWNISMQKAGIPHWAPNFPTFRLAGSIVHTWYQGGNFWWDFGHPNPYNGAVNKRNHLPYDENATTLIVYVYGPSYYYSTYIYNGGDYVPL
jgi:thermopsin